MALVLGSGAAFADVPMTQVNVSGAEFSENVFPGVEGTHYFFPREGFFANWKRRGVQSVRSRSNGSDCSLRWGGRWTLSTPS